MLQNFSFCLVCRLSSQAAAAVGHTEEGADTGRQGLLFIFRGPPRLYLSFCIAEADGIRSREKKGTWDAHGNICHFALIRAYVRGKACDRGQSATARRWTWLARLDLDRTFRLHRISSRSGVVTKLKPAVRASPDGAGFSACTYIYSSFVSGFAAASRASYYNSQVALCRVFFFFAEVT